MRLFMRWTQTVLLAAGVILWVPGCSDPAGSQTRVGTTARPASGAGSPELHSSDHVAHARAHADATGASRSSAGGTGASGVPGLDMRASGPAAPPDRAAVAAPAPRNGAYQEPRTLAPPWIGGARAKVVISEFTDFECPFCQRAFFTVEKLLRHYGARIKLVFRHLPLSSIHPQARIAAEAAVCAQAQGRFWAMERMLFRHRSALSKANILHYARNIGLDVARFRRDLEGGACKVRVDKDLAEAHKRQVEGTPCFFIGGVKYEGALPFERMRKLIDAELAP